MLGFNFILGLRHVSFVYYTLSNITIPKLTIIILIIKKIQPIINYSYIMCSCIQFSSQTLPNNCFLSLV